MIIRELTGVPLEVYKKIAARYNIYNLHDQEFEYILNGQTRKKPKFKYNDPQVEQILNEAKDYFNTNSSSSVYIKSLTCDKDNFELLIASDYPLEGPSRTLALFGQRLTENDTFAELISGTSIIKYTDQTISARKSVMDQFETHQKTMSDAKLINFFVDCMTDGYANCTSEQKKFIEKVKTDLYQFMASPYEYVSNLES